MTREEQVDWLCRLRAELNSGVLFTPWNKEFTEALTDILEQEPCEVESAKQAYSKGFEDCRQAVLDILGYVMDYWKEHAIDVEPHEIEDALIEQYEFTAKQINELPPVTPQPKTGHWIFKQFDEETGISNNYWCSECGKPLAQVYKTYCANCGARMYEPQESEE